MDEYEVDLRDYLRVLWERKWIVVGVFLVAVLAAAAYSYTLPDEYEASALLHWDGEFELQGVEVTLSDSNTVLELLKTIRVQPKTELRASLLGNSRSLSSFVDVRLQGPFAPAELERLLNERIEAVRDFLRTQMQADVERQLSFLSQQIEVLSGSRAELLQQMKQWIEQRVEALNRQEKASLALLEQREGSPGGSEGSVTPNVIALSALLVNLQALAQERLRLLGELDSPYPRPGSGFDAPLAALDAQLQQLQLSQEMYRIAAESLAEGRLNPLEIVRPPQGTEAPIGPPRALNVAVAGVLGLFVGILLAFFVNYLASEPPQPRPAGQREGEQAAS